MYCYYLAFISTHWVIHKYNKQCLQTPSNKQLSLEYILSDATGFTLFADYLVKQFSIEHLLFLFDIMKLKQELIAMELSFFFEVFLICYNLCCVQCTE